MGHFRPLLATRYTPNRGLLRLSRQSLEEEFSEVELPLYGVLGSSHNPVLLRLVHRNGARSQPTWERLVELTAWQDPPAIPPRDLRGPRDAVSGGSRRRQRAPSPRAPSWRLGPLPPLPTRLQARPGSGTPPS